MTKPQGDIDRVWDAVMKLLMVIVVGAGSWLVAETIDHHSRIEVIEQVGFYESAGLREDLAEIKTVLYELEKRVREVERP